MLSNTASETGRYTVQVRQRGQITIPRQARKALALEEGDSLTVVHVGDALVLTPVTPRVSELADKIADMLDEAGLSLADLLADLPRIRSEIYRETYGDEVA